MGLGKAGSDWVSTEPRDPAKAPLQGKIAALPATAAALRMPDGQPCMPDVPVRVPDVPL